MTVSSAPHPSLSPAPSDAPLPLPEPRGPVSAALVDLLSLQPWATRIGEELTWTGDHLDAGADEDLQLALFLAYELHYRGIAGVAEEWEWQPGLIGARQEWERALLDCCAARVGPSHSLAAGNAAQTAKELFAMASEESGPTVSQYLMRDASAEQFREFLAHRSIYHLKEADPHTWALPRLSGPAKAAMVAIQFDEYGLGRLAAMHATLFSNLLRSWGMDSRYGHYVDVVPGVTLLGSNLISLFGLHRRWRGALVGHLTLFEMTSSAPNSRYARGHRRLGGSEESARFYDEHVVADALHEQIAAYELAGGLITAEPALAGDVIFGARCAQYADEQFAAYVLPRWQRGQSSLRMAGTGVETPR